MPSRKCRIVAALCRDSRGHEKSWNLKMNFPGLEKSWILGKMTGVMQKGMDFHFCGSNISCCLKTGNILFVIIIIIMAASAEHHA